MSDRVEALYLELTKSFPHPFDWISLLERPPFWRRRWVLAHKKVCKIFEEHAFELTSNVAERYYRRFPNDWELYGLDAGGMMVYKLKRALNDQAPKD